MEIQKETLRVFRDTRGIVFEPVSAAELAAQQNVHVVLTQPGEVRGNHYHREATEILSTVGPALVRLRSAGVVTDYQVPAGEVWRFVLPPGTSHAIQHPGPGPGLAVSFSTRAHNPHNPDTHRDVLIEQQ